MAMSNRAPGPRGLPITGQLFWVKADSLQFLLNAHARYGDIVRMRMVHLILHSIASPESIEQVLKKSHKNYIRTTPTNARLIDIIGENLLTTDGPKWQQRRKAIAPIFSPERCQEFVPVISRITKSMAHKWRKSQKPIIVNPDMMGLTLAIITEILFGVPIGKEAPRLESALTAVLDHHWRRVQSPNDLPHRIPNRGRSAFKAGVKTLRDITGRLKAQANSDRIAAILSRLSGLQADDELITLLLAGHETTANALNWACYLLGQHPECQECLRDEAKAVLGDREATAADVPRLVYATSVFQEAMRLYPPIWLIDRLVVADDNLCGYHIPADTTVVVAPWVVHRNPDYWPNPSEFNPTRFEKRPRPYTYIPFGAGPHGCVGGHLAMIEGPLILAELIRHVRLMPLTKIEPKPMPGLTLRMKKPLSMRVEPI